MFGVYDFQNSLNIIYRQFGKNEVEINMTTKSRYLQDTPHAMIPNIIHNKRIFKY